MRIFLYEYSMGQPMLPELARDGDLVPRSPMEVLLQMDVNLERRLVS